MIKTCITCHYDTLSAVREPCVTCGGNKPWLPKTPKFGENELTSPNTVRCPHCGGKLTLSGGEP